VLPNGNPAVVALQALLRNPNSSEALDALKEALEGQPDSLFKRIWCYVHLVGAKIYLEQTEKSATQATEAYHQAMRVMQHLTPAVVERLKNEKRVCQEAHAAAFQAVLDAKKACKIAKQIAESASRSSGQELEAFFQAADEAEDLAADASSSAMAALNEVSQARANIVY